MKVGVIGAGTMGSGIAQAFAQAEGYEVVLCDINDEFAARGKEKLKKGFDKRIAKGKMEQAVADSILSKITTGTKEKCGDCDLIIEAAVENMEIKNKPLKNYRQFVNRKRSLQQILLPYPLQKLEQDWIDRSLECTSLTLHRL